MSQYDVSDSSHGVDRYKPLSEIWHGQILDALSIVDLHSRSIPSQTLDLPAIDSFTVDCCCSRRWFCHDVRANYTLLRKTHVMT